MFRAAILLPLPLALAACGPHEGNTSFSINAHGEDGNVSIRSDKSGRAEIKVPGFAASITLPRIDIDAEEFDVDGLKLYPGSTIRDFNVDATERAGDDNDARVAVSFESPASLAKVQAWFRDAMARQNFTVSPAGTGFAGTTNDGQPIAVELEADGAEKVKGKLTITG